MKVPAKPEARVSIDCKSAKTNLIYRSFAIGLSNEDLMKMASCSRIPDLGAGDQPTFASPVSCYPVEFRNAMRLVPDRADSPVPLELKNHRELDDSQLTMIHLLLGSWSD
jgi:hypothetical protein